MVFLNDIKASKLKLEEEKNLQKGFNKLLKNFRKRSKSGRQKTLENIEMLFKWRNNAAKFLEDYGSIILEAKKKKTEGKGIKVLTSKQILQRLPITNSSCTSKIR